MLLSRICFFVFFLYSAINLYAAEENSSESEEYYQKALKAFNNKNYEGSLEHIRKIIHLDLKNPKLRYLAAHNYWKLKNYDPSIAHFKVFLEVAPQYPSGYIDMALLLLEKQAYEDARRRADQGINFLRSGNKPAPIKLFNIIARTYLYQGNSEKTLEYVELAKGKFSQEDQRVYDKVETLLLEARIYLLLKKFAKAEIAVLWALEIIPKSEYTLNLLGLLYSQWAKQGNDLQKKELSEKAKETFEKALYHLDESSSLYNIIRTNLNSL